MQHVQPGMEMESKRTIGVTHRVHAFFIYGADPRIQTIPGCRGEALFIYEQKIRSSSHAILCG
jgi:hypothetical protein